jgi:hypothetical protein
MDMAAMKEKLIIRLTGQQARFLAEVVINEQRSKSEIARQALNQLLIEKSNNKKDNQAKNEETKK